jgi:SOS response regulatory protein OraA/RecX|uniref:Copper amine oxidase n=1 Tax=Phage sp. ctPjm15 TaxID=2828006 RepID=A0A8S5SPM7_9VIRU|nr:MAG TPA: copper amine oxidase [Phage sp. ctPjm15]
MFFMKKAKFISAALLTMSLAAAPAFASDIKLEINGSIVQPTVAPVIENGTTLVPLRIVSQNLGSQVDWNGADRSITITKDGKEILLTVDSKKAVVAGQEKELLLAPKIINSTTMVPIRFVSENLDAYVNWDSASRTVQVSDTNDFTKPTTPTTPTQTVTTGQKNALAKANSYLSHSSFSRQGLIEQLEYEKFSTEEATYAVDNCGANWSEQAEKKAKSYLSHSAFSYSGLIEQLEYEGFTHDQAVYGVEKSGADWNEQAVKKAASYLKHSSFSRQGLIDQLEYEGFTNEQAVYGVSKNGY